MAFIPFAAGVAEIHLNGEVDGIPCQNIIGAKFNAGAASQSDGQALATAVEASIITNNWLTHMNQNFELISVEVIDLTSASGWTAAQSSLTSGAITTAPVQSQVALVTTFLTAKRGRSYRGRNFLPGLSQADLNDSRTWSSTTLTNWGARYADVASDINTAGWTPVVLSRIQGGVPLSLGVTTPITGYRPNALLGTIRGRLT